VRPWHEEHLRRLPLVDALPPRKRVFHVSFWLLYTRVSQVGLTGVKHPVLVSQAKRHLRIDGTARTEDLEPEPLPPRSLYRPTRFGRLARSAFTQERISPAKVAGLLQVTVDQAQEPTAQWPRPPHAFVGGRPVRHLPSGRPRPPPAAP
jgi:hypothetical protein